MERNNTKGRIVTIIDWDDTLFPTTWVLESGINLTDPISRLKNIKHFELLDERVSSTLREIMKCGTVVIITNAMPEWVQLSSSILPKTKSYLRKIEIISARKKYQGKLDQGEWKKMAFKKLLIDIDDDSIDMVMSIGDAEYEYQALIELLDLGYRNLKSIKFVRYPGKKEVFDQLKIVQKYAKSLCELPKSFDLVFDSKK
jgi:hypothetical protein